jgi:hypothetical protein
VSDAQLESQQLRIESDGTIQIRHVDHLTRTESQPDADSGRVSARPISCQAAPVCVPLSFSLCMSVCVVALTMCPSATPFVDWNRSADASGWVNLGLRYMSGVAAAGCTSAAEAKQVQ